MKIRKIAERCSSLDALGIPFLHGFLESRCLKICKNITKVWLSLWKNGQFLNALTDYSKEPKCWYIIGCQASSYCVGLGATAKYVPAVDFGTAQEKFFIGAEWLFISGITAALGDGPLMSLHNAIAAARNSGVKIAFDTNFRPTLWQGREDQAARILRNLSCEADLIFAGRRAVSMMAGGSFDHADPDQGFHAAAEKMFALAPRLNHIAATRRNALSTDRQELTGLLADREGLSTSPIVALENIVDRVGTGDAFAVGIMHGLLTGKSRSESVNFATACSHWANSVPGDFLRASVDDIDRLGSGSSDVKR